MAYKSEDIKKLNSISLLKKLYDLNSATMLELVKITSFSQSSVRSILRDLEVKGVLELQKVDQSTGGRCPVRYALSNAHFQVLSVFIGEGTVNMKLRDVLNNISLDDYIVCAFDDVLESKIIDIIKNNQVNCISIASSGVVQNDCFYTDHGEAMTKHEIALHLRDKLDIPVIIENDVKCMMMGMQSKRYYDNLAYVYMNQTGVGSAYYTNEHIIKGQQAFSGELGLLPYHNQTINECIASSPSKEILEDIYVQILTTVAVTIDPEKIIVSGKLLPNISMSTIKAGIEKCLSKRYIINIEESLNPLDDALNGLHYLGILKLFDVYTNYKRSNKNG